MVNQMKRIPLIVAIVFSLAGSMPALAEEQAASAVPLETVVSDTETSVTVDPEVSRPMAGMGMRHKGSCKQGKGQHGKGQHGNKHGGMQHRGGHDGNGQHEEHDQVVHRLDMIEARMAKIEAMLETLMRR
jgi:hypothetical protein